MHIVHINRLYPPDAVAGVGYTVRNLAEAQVRRGHQVTVLAQAKMHGDAPSAPTTSIQNGVRVLRGPGQVLLGEDTIDWNQVSVVHTHWLSGFTGPELLYRTQRLPTLHTAHEYSLFCGHSLLIRADGSSCLPKPELCRHCHDLPAQWSAFTRHIDKFTVLSQAMREIFEDQLSRFDPPLENPGILGNSLDTDFHMASTDREIRNQRAQDWLKPDTPLRIGFLGRLHISKGVSLFLELARSSPFATFYMAGPADDARSRQWLEAASTIPNLTYVGTADAKAFLDSVDILCVPSASPEAFGRVVIEAFARGVPTMTSAMGALAEMGKQAGWVIDEPTPEAWHAQLLHLHNHRKTIHDQYLNTASAAAMYEADAIAGMADSLYAESIEHFRAACAGQNARQNTVQKAKP